jgi:hypothetical protein
MFSRRVFGGTPDSFKLVLEYGRETAQAPMLGQVRLPMALATSEVRIQRSGPEAAGKRTGRSSAEPCCPLRASCTHTSVGGWQQRVVTSLAARDAQVTWNSEETVEVVLERFAQAKSRVQLDRAEERLVLKLTPSPSGDRVSAKLSVACLAPALRCVQVVRVTTSGEGMGRIIPAALLNRC